MNANSAMTLSQNGAHFIANEEGCRLEVYDDKTGNKWDFTPGAKHAGYPTIGIGHLIPQDKNGRLLEHFENGITQDQAYSLFARDQKRYIDAVKIFALVPLTQNQFDACASLCYNIGVEAFRRSSVVRFLNQKNYSAAANAFLLWKFDSHGHPVLLPRRQRERLFFLR